eukprot:422497_1
MAMAAGSNLNRFKNIISIDFGSFGSTAHYSLPDLKSIYHVKDWADQVNLDRTMEKKTLTALLWDVNNRKVISFGYQALKEYTDYKQYQNLIKKNDQQGIKKMSKKLDKKGLQKLDFYKDAKLVYFDHFKPHLLGSDRLNKDKYMYPIGYDKTDRNAPKLSILDLVTYSLIEIKNQSLKEAGTLRQESGIDFKDNEELKEDEVFWVLGTPAVWDDMSRGAFKNCVINAGMKYHEIGLEPEFALFCVKYHDEATYLETSKKYIILDCGAGTTDATCVELINGNELMEVTARKGVDIGSLMIDDEYYKMLDDIFGSQFMTKFKQHYPSRWNRMKIKFWTSKHGVMPNAKMWNVDTEYRFGKEFEKQLKCSDDIKDYDSELFDQYITDLCRKKYQQNVMYEDGALMLNISIWENFHKNVLNEICKFIKTMLSDKNMSECKDIILVGGFSDSKFLQNRLKNEFKEIEFHSANDSSWSVSIGGLYRLVHTSDLKYRKMWLTYGLEVNAEWNPDLDDDTNKHADANSSTGFVKNNVFDAIIFKNDVYIEHEKIIKNYTIPIAAGKLELNVFSVDCEQGVNYTTDEKCEISVCFALPLKNHNIIQAAQDSLPITIELEKTTIKITITVNDELYEMPITIRKQPEMLKAEGNKLFRQRKYEEALEKYNEAIEYDDQNAVYYSNRAAAFLHLNKWSHAVIDGQKAIELDPNYTKAYARIGKGQYELGNYKEAKISYSEALNRTDKTQSYNARKLYQKYIGKCDESISNCILA